jgi:hypothetical protein
MDNPRMWQRAICGEERSAEQVWFLVAENHWADNLKVLECKMNWRDDEESMRPAAGGTSRN